MQEQPDRKGYTILASTLMIEAIRRFAGFARLWKEENDADFRWWGRRPESLVEALDMAQGALNALRHAIQVPGEPPAAGTFSEALTAFRMAQPGVFAHWIDEDLVVSVAEAMVAITRETAAQMLLILPMPFAAHVAAHIALMPTCLNVEGQPPGVRWYRPPFEETTRGAEHLLSILLRLPSGYAHTLETELKKAHGQALQMLMVEILKVDYLITIDEGNRKELMDENLYRMGIEDHFLQHRLQLMPFWHLVALREIVPEQVREVIDRNISQSLRSQLVAHRLEVGAIHLSQSLSRVLGLHRVLLAALGLMPQSEIDDARRSNGGRL